MDKGSKVKFGHHIDEILERIVGPVLSASLQLGLEL